MGVGTVLGSGTGNDVSGEWPDESDHTRRLMCGEHGSTGVEDARSCRKLDAVLDEEQNHAVINRVLNGGSVREGEPHAPRLIRSRPDNLPTGTEQVDSPPASKISPRVCL